MSAALDAAGRLLIALDIDGTVLGADGTIPSATTREVHRLVRDGHEVMLATGRSVSDTLPIRERLGILPRFIVSSNGAITLERDAASPTGYTTRWVETFDPTETIRRLSGVLEHAHYAVEGPDGIYRYAGGRFPDGSFESYGVEVPVEELADEPVTRLVVVAPDQTTEDFMGRIEQSGLHHVSYSVGWTAWLDIAPDGVNKGTALERVRAALGTPRHDIVVAGDGRNDIEMLAWAKAGGGRAIVMSEAPDEVIGAGTDIAPDFEHDGLARALEGVGRRLPELRA